MRFSFSTLGRIHRHTKKHSISNVWLAGLFFMHGEFQLPVACFNLKTMSCQIYILYMCVCLVCVLCKLNFKHALETRYVHVCVYTTPDNGCVMVVDNEKSKVIVPFKHLQSIIMWNIQINLNINYEVSDRCGLALAYECTNAQIMTQKYMLKSSHKKDIFCFPWVDSRKLLGWLASCKPLVIYNFDKEFLAQFMGP